MELYYTVTVTDRDRDAKVAKLYEISGVRAVLTLLGRGTATGEHLDFYGLNATEKAVVCGVADARQAAQLFKLGRRMLQIDIPGNGIMMTIPLKSVAGGRTLAYLTGNTRTGGRPNMTFEHELIIVIMNEGCSDLVMDAARSVPCCTPKERPAAAASAFSASDWPRRRTCSTSSPMPTRRRPSCARSARRPDRAQRLGPSASRCRSRR